MFDHTLEPPCQGPKFAQAQRPAQHVHDSQVKPSGEKWSLSGKSGDLGRYSLSNPAKCETITELSQPEAAQFRTARIIAQRSPFLPPGGKPHTAEPSPSPASENPPMPPKNPLQQYTPMPAMGIASQSAGPSIFASPANFSQKVGHTPQATTSYSSAMVQQGGGVQFQAPLREVPYSTPAPQTEGSPLQGSTGSSRQLATDPVHFLTFATLAQTYRIPVDMHQASRLADEKRARNAGALARFRQRRKEKEQEANISIEKLQQQTRELERKVREVEQERDFYRAERDRLQDVINRTPGMRHLVMQAPPSPQSMPSMSQVGNPPPSLPPQGNFTSLPPMLPPASTLLPVQACHPAGPGQRLTSFPPLRFEDKQY